MLRWRNFEIYHIHKGPRLDLPEFCQNPFAQERDHNDDATQIRELHKVAELRTKGRQRISTGPLSDLRYCFVRRRNGGRQRNQPNREWAHGATRGTDDNFVTTGPRDRARCIKIASTRLQVTCRCKTWHRSFGQNTIWCPCGMQCFCYTWQRQCAEMSVTRRCNARFWYKLHK